MRHTKAATLARVRGEYRALDRIVRGLSAADFRRRVFESETRESWTVKDALAHIVAWKWNACRGLTPGARRGPGAPAAANVGEANARIYRRWHWRSARRVVEEHREVQRALVAALQTRPDDFYTSRERSAQWPFDAVGHSAEHRRRHLEPRAGHPK